MSAHPQANAFLRAAYEGKIETVIEMLDEGVPVETSNQTGLQALHFAAKTHNVELADVLIKRGADVNVSTQKGTTPLHVASLMGHTEVVKLLLRNEAQTNMQSDCYGDLFSPLYMSAQIGHQEIVTLLLAHGADPTHKTKNGSTARDVARQQGFTAVAELLREYERRTKKSRRAQVAAASGMNESDESEGNDSQDDQSAEASPRHRRLGTPPMCHGQDVCASPKNSPKRLPRRPHPQLSNGDST